MLRSVGLNSPEELFDTIPADILLRDLLNTPPALSEPELIARFETLAAKNSAAHRPSFLGAGAYSHYQPTIVDSLISRSEFFTAYTPYQPEISQGTLQAIFEFQTLVCQLTGMDVANASMYDGRPRGRGRADGELITAPQGGRLRRAPSPNICTLPNLRRTRRKDLSAPGSTKRQARLISTTPRARSTNRRRRSSSSHQTSLAASKICSRSPNARTRSARCS